MKWYGNGGGLLLHGFREEFIRLLRLVHVLLATDAEILGRRGNLV